MRRSKSGRLFLKNWPIQSWFLTSLKYVVWGGMLETWVRVDIEALSPNSLGKEVENSGKFSIFQF